MKENITTKNSKGELHGYQQWYWDGDELAYRGHRKSYLKIGYIEYHMAKRTNFYII